MMCDRPTFYADIRHDLKTFDLVLFSGKGRVSELIKKVSGPWSHVGMVIRGSACASVHADDDLVLLWESTTLTDLPDMVTGKKVKGVQTHLLSKRLQSYDGEVCVRHLVGRSQLPPTYGHTLKKARREFSGRPYEKSVLELGRSALDESMPDAHWGWKALLWVICMGKQENEQKALHSLFCSELVAEVLQRVGILKCHQTGGVIPSEYTPTDFARPTVPHIRCDSFGYGPMVPIIRA